MLTRATLNVKENQIKKYVMRFEKKSKQKKE